MLEILTIYVLHQVTGLKLWPETGKGNTASASMTSGAFASVGGLVMPMKSRLSIITEG